MGEGGDPKVSYFRISIKVSNMVIATNSPLLSNFHSMFCLFLLQTMHKNVWENGQSLNENRITDLRLFRCLGL